MQQFLGYRMILVSTGMLGDGYMDEDDFTLFREWLDYTGCGMPDLRRGLLFFGDRVADIIDYRAPTFLEDVLGATYVAETYREYNQDPAQCIYLEPATGATFEPDPPGIALYSPGIPLLSDFRILRPAAGTAGAFGNLDYYSYLGTGLEPYVHFAQVLRDNSGGGTANWMTAVHGFSLMALSERDCGGGDCSGDSACVVRGGVELLRPMIAWMEDPLQPFESWRLACGGLDVRPDESHLHGAVNHLYDCRPNPFSARAAIRFNLAQTGTANLVIYDLSGRLVRTLVDGQMEAGEHTLDWDGLDAHGTRLGAGVYWMQLRTADGYCSSKRLLRLN